MSFSTTLQSYRTTTASSKDISPLVELDQLLQRQDDRLKRAKEAYIRKVTRPSLVESFTATTSSSAKKSSFFTSFTRRSANTTASPSASTTNANPPATATVDSCTTKESIAPKTPTQKSHLATAQRSLQEKQNNVKFISIPEQDSFVEDLRRIAELVVIGENYVTSVEKKRQKEIDKLRQRNNGVDISIDEPPSEDDMEEDVRSPDYADVFDLFFEHNTLAIWVNLLRGDGFDLTTENEEEKTDNSGTSTAHDHSRSQAEEGSESQTKLLPPLAVATQVVQSISILVQNVSRATSLYILFSNDYINDLISLDLEVYEMAERNLRLSQKTRKSSDDNSPAAMIFASPEVAELTTHFVTFLKSLALRMNAETLQFFLQYPDKTTTTTPLPTTPLSNGQSNNPLFSPGGNPIDGCDPADLVSKFPLYDRALDFCAAHQDSFVRVTAMNICLNTIRLTTVSDSPLPTWDGNEEDIGLEEMEGAFGGAVNFDSPKNEPTVLSTSTPNASLHNAQALPFRERLAIAHYTCSPTRVERLIAPIFTKLSERWSSLDESIRAMDEFELASSQETGSRIEKVAKVREKVKREKLVNAFRDKTADLQDELLLLEDVFKVGLIVLNEQMIEMMMATFVYPLLLQPLILFSQRFTAVLLEADQSSFPLRRTILDHPFGDSTLATDKRDAQRQLVAVTGPAKTALFTMAAAFQLLTNPPLIRLMFTALLHPISPDSTTVPTVRSTLQVASVDKRGRGSIRVDANIEGELVPDSRMSYPFGSKQSPSYGMVTNGNAHNSTGKNACVFVLAPALAEVLRFQGDDYGLIARTKSNSYRKALLQCIHIELPEFVVMRELAVSTLDSAVSRVDSKLAADLLFGVNFKTFADDIPMDERNLDSTYAYQEHDRGLGKSIAVESRHSISDRRGGVGADLVRQVILPLVTAVMTAKRGFNQEWMLSYDGLAAHTLITLGKGNAGALMSCSKSLDIRRNQSAQYLAQLPKIMHRPQVGGPASFILAGIPQSNVPNYDSQMHGGVINALVYGVVANDQEAPMGKFLQLQKRSSAGREEGLSVDVSICGRFDDMIQRVSSTLVGGTEMSDAKQQRNVVRMVKELRESFSVFFRVDSLLSLFKELSVSGGVSMQSIDIAGIAFSENGSFVRTMDYEYSKNVYAPISQNLSNVLLSTSTEASDSIVPGETLKLAGYPAIPCVCEAPASLSHLFLHNDSGIVAQGVTWQSLYLVFKNGWMVFAQPIPGGPSGEGRIIGGCLLERTFVDKDSSPVDQGSPARRILFSHASFNPNPPPLFLFDELPKKDNGHPLGRMTMYISHLDVWCENQRASNYAYQVASSQIFAAKASRGRRLLSFLSPGNGFPNVSTT